MGKGKEWFWEPGEEKARPLEERGKARELGGVWTTEQEHENSSGLFHRQGTGRINNYLPSLS